MSVSYFASEVLDIIEYCLLSCLDALVSLYLYCRSDQSRGSQLLERKLSLERFDNRRKENVLRKHLLSSGEVLLAFIRWKVPKY
jgi:hypothetical protein